MSTTQTVELGPCNPADDGDADEGGTAAADDVRVAGHQERGIG
jgi:hypothetical protein